MGKLKEIVCECNRQVEQAPPKKKQKTCADLGREKHVCCEKAIQELKHADSGRAGLWKETFEPIPMTRQALKAASGKEALKETSWPDCTLEDENGKKGFVDFKFKCPPNTPTRKKNGKWIRSRPRPGQWPKWTEYKDGANQYR